MHLEAILEQDIFQLPAINDSGMPFIAFIEQKLERYIHDIGVSSADLFTNSPPQIHDFREYIELITEVARGLISVIRTANGMMPHEAYPQFQTVMGKMRFLLLAYPDALYTLESKQSFYRCKFYEAAPDVATIDNFFHTAFQYRHLVGATRFTHAGLPALYLTNTLAVGYHEVRATGLSGFQAVKLHTKRHVRANLLDLDYNRPKRSLRGHDQERYDLQLQLKGLLFPLMLCCFSQKNGPGAAPPEYIIPQLLLRWVMESKGFLVGIKYPSTRISGAHYDGSFFNLILPPVELPDIGYCPQLKNMFQVSEVCGYTPHFGALSAHYGDNFTTPQHVNNSIISIDWNAMLEIYDTSELGKMEFYLNSLATTPLPF